MTQANFIVIGAGIAGAGVAFELAQHASVIVLEAESQPGYHSTGRSAALFSEIYGNEVVRTLSRASREFLLNPPIRFAAESLLKSRGCLFIAPEISSQRSSSFVLLRTCSTHTRELSSDEALAFVPILKREWAAHNLLEDSAYDVDVHTLHQGFLRGMKERGSTLASASLVQSIVRELGVWKVVAGGHEFRAPVIINSAGAWVDEIAKLAGVRPIGIEPRRRTAVMVDPPAGVSVDAWPMVMDAGESFYFKPDAGRLLLSPADESPNPPADVQPEDLDVAIAVDRMEQATTLSVQHVRHRWAGLRSFVADRSPVAGYDPDTAGFFGSPDKAGTGFKPRRRYLDWPRIWRACPHLVRQRWRL